MNNSVKIKCPTCKRDTLWNADNPTRPFCSERCRLIDLGEWLDEKKVIAGDENKNSDESED